MDPSAGNRAYEDFVPPHSMVREPATHTLTVDLSDSGYKKEHIRVQMVHSHRRLIVRGERPVAGNRWSRFRLEFKVPDGCDTKAISARFEGGVVRVTLPGGLAPEPVAVEAQKEPSPPSATANPLAAAAAGVHRDGADEKQRGDQEKAQKQQDADRSGKDGGGRDEGAGAGGEVVTAAAADSPPRRGGAYAFLQERRKLGMGTTALGVLLVLFSLGVYFRYSLWP